MIDSTNALNSFSNFQSSKIIEDISKHKNKNISEADGDKLLREQTDKFEAIFLKTLLDTALNMDNAMYPKAPGSDIYNSMYKDSLANNLSGSFGYSELLFNFLKEKQKQS